MYISLHQLTVKLITLVILVFVTGICQAQMLLHDTLTVLNYNTDNYGFPATESCPGLLTQNKHEYLRTLVQYNNPDIIGLTKMDASPASFVTDTVTEKVLNAGCPGCYDHATFTNQSGYGKANMLYFKTTKLGFISTTVIYSGDPNISDIDLHKLYYKTPDLAGTHDTTFIHVILAHLQSGSGSASDRATEVTGAMNWLNAHVTAAGNYIFMGDFNTQSSDENCFQSLINSSNVNTRFYDPPNQLGDWANNPTAFANYLTQSTRLVDPGDCSSTNGITYRYDHILCSKTLMLGGDSVIYVPDSYRVIGQDGNHTGLALTDPPANTSVPSQLLSNLYYMSEHLPVTLQLAITKPVYTGISNSQRQPLHVNFNRVVKNSLQLNLSQDGRMEASCCLLCIYGVQGQLVYEAALSLNEMTIDASSFTPGIYFLSISDNDGMVLNDRFLKVAE